MIEAILWIGAVVASIYFWPSGRGESSPGRDSLNKSRKDDEND